MKRRILGVLLMLLVLISAGLTVSAATKETYFEENGVQYCWVRGSSVERPTEEVTGYTWIAVREGNKQVSQVGACDAHNIVGHTCGDIWDRYERLEYKWQLVVKELLVIECRDKAGYSMEGSKFILFKQIYERDDAGNLVTYVDSDGVVRVTHLRNELVGEGYVGKDGYARLRLKEDVLDPTEDFHQVILGQELTGEQLDEYSSLQNRWYVNFTQNGDGEYELCSITEAPPITLTDYEELKNSNFDKQGEGFVPEYDEKSQILYIRNAFRVGDLFVNVKVEGFQGEIPSTVSTIVDITGPHEYNKKVRKNIKLENMRMGDYNIKWSEPATVAGYNEKAPEVKATVLYPVNGATKELTADDRTVTLHRDHANAEVTITYTYFPDHVHTYDEGIVTEPTCTEQGYTTYTCTDSECGYAYNDNYVSPYGHDYEETIIESNCTEDGRKIYTCAFCGDTYEEAGDSKTGHTYETVVTDPTCEKQGYTTYSCIDCDYSYIDDYKDALGHDFKPNKEVEPSCTENGYTLEICALCKAENKKMKEDQPATGHNYDAGVKTEPTCTEKGYTTYSCTNEECEYSYQGDFKDALGHKYTSQVIEPTKDREGYTLHTCERCKDSYTDNVKDKLPSNNSSGTDSSDKKSDKDSSDKMSDKNSNSSSNSGNSGSNAGSGSSAKISGSASDALVVKFYDEDNQPLNSGAVALYNGKTQLKSWSCTYDNVAVMDNLEKYATEGTVVSYTLKQSKAMDGYEVSKDSFTVQLQKQNGNLTVKVTKTGKSSKESKVENGRDGKPIVSFCNTKETTQFEISCMAYVEFAENCMPDETMMKEYLQKEYKFTLNWTTEEGEEKSESLTLSNGGSASWKAKLPFGTDYSITATDPDGNVIMGLAENASGTLSAKQMDEKVKVEANIAYQVKAATPTKLEMNVIDPNSKTPLRGANFELRNPDGEKIATFISRESGKFYMEDVFPVLGDYLLVQSKAPEGYAPISGGIPMTVSYAYAPESENNVLNLMQSKSVEFAHQAVSAGDDGSFTIENETYDVVVDNSSKKDKKIGLLLGIGGGVLAAGACGAGAFVIAKKKRGKNIVEDVENTEATEV